MTEGDLVLICKPSVRAFGIAVTLRDFILLQWLSLTGESEDHFLQSDSHYLAPRVKQGSLLLLCSVLDYKPSCYSADVAAHLSGVFDVHPPSRGGPAGGPGTSEYWIPRSAPHRQAGGVRVESAD